MSSETDLERGTEPWTGEIDDHRVDVHEHTIDDSLGESVLTGGVLILVGSVLAGFLQGLHLDLNFVQVLRNGQC